MQSTVARLLRCERNQQLPTAGWFVGLTIDSQLLSACLKALHGPAPAYTCELLTAQDALARRD